MMHDIIWTRISFFLAHLDEDNTVATSVKFNKTPLLISKEKFTIRTTIIFREGENSEADLRSKRQIIFF